MLDSPVVRPTEGRARRHPRQLPLTDERPDGSIAAAIAVLEPEQDLHLVPPCTRQPLIWLTAPQKHHPARRHAALLAARRAPPDEALRPVVQERSVDLVAELKNPRVRRALRRDLDGFELVARQAATRKAAQRQGEAVPDLPI